MNRRRLIVLGLAGALAIVVAVPMLRITPQAQAEGGPTPVTPALVAKGEYLAKAADCVACHTAPGGKPYAGGLAFKLPFGTMYSTNITADRATGIGAYSDDDFVRALHQGVRHDGRRLYPSMPYTAYTGMSREDALAIKAYLFSLPQVSAPARAPSFGFPFNQRWTLAVWDALFLKDRRFAPDPKLTAQQNRGAYLATALGHCGECHTPRNIAFALKGDRQFAGAELQGWRAFNITSDPHAGIGAWSDEALADYLSTGRADGHGSASGPMLEAVSHSLQSLTPQDIEALVAYLKSVKPQKGMPATDADPAPPLQRASTAGAPGPGEPAEGLGRHIFEGACAGCHAWNGSAQGSAYTALAGARALSDPTGLNVAQAVLRGANLPVKGQGVFMPAFGQAYGDAEVAAVSNYVLGRFGNVKGAVTPDQVRRARSAR